VGTDSPLDKRVGDRLLVVAPWEEFRAHVRRALANDCVRRVRKDGTKGRFLSVGITNDRDLKEIMLNQHQHAHEAIKRLAPSDDFGDSRSAATLRELSKTYVSVMDEPDLVIFRIGLQFVKNDDMPNVVRQCLSVREDGKRGPRGLWIHMEPTVQWGRAQGKTDRSCVSWSPPDLAKHIETNYPLVSLLPKAVIEAIESV
jgi:hypothetical protein